MDEGRLTDGQGRLVDFKNTLVICTSNVGADALLRGTHADGQRASCLGGGEKPREGLGKAARAEVMRAVKARFPPELLNRFDETAIYNPLSSDGVAGILRLQMHRYCAPLEARKVQVDMDEAAARLIVSGAYNPCFGARPLKRLLERVCHHPTPPSSPFLIFYHF